MSRHPAHNPRVLPLRAPVVLACKLRYHLDLPTRKAASSWYVIVLTKDSFTDEALRAWTNELRVVLGERGVSFR